MVFDRRIRRVAGTIALSAVVTVVGASIFAAVDPAAANAAVVALSSVACTGTATCVTGSNSGSGVGVRGTSVTGTGVIGSTNGGPYAIVGSATGSGVGVSGVSSKGPGILGNSSSGNGITGQTHTGNAVEASAAAGTALYAHSSSAGNAIVAFNNTNAPTIYARNTAGNGLDIGSTNVGVIARAPASGGYPFMGINNSGGTVFYVSGNGDIHYAGSLLNFARVSGGATVMSFSARTTLPTVEDTGSAQLVGGVATVRLDPTFAASIDRVSSYRVFLTPDGDTRGLFVATKTPVGFVVRETQGGRGSFTFDYRIVATAVGEAGKHIAVVNESLLPHVPDANTASSAQR